MRIIKLAVISFVFLFLLVTGISLLIPSHVRISKAIDVRAESDSVFALLQKDKWPLWHPAFQPQNNVQAGNDVQELQTKIIVQNDSVLALEMQQKESMVIINTWQLHTFENSTATTLQWYLDFNLGWWPWEKFGSLFYEDVYGKMMEQGLANIKEIVETK